MSHDAGLSDGSADWGKLTKSLWRGTGKLWEALRSNCLTRDSCSFQLASGDKVQSLFSPKWKPGFIEQRKIWIFPLSTAAWKVQRLCKCVFLKEKEKIQRVDFRLSCGRGAWLPLTSQDWLCCCCCVSCFGLQELPSLHTMQQLVLMPPSHLSSPSPFLLSQSPTSHQGIKHQTKQTCGDSFYSQLRRCPSWAARDRRGTSFLLGFQWTHQRQGRFSISQASS